LSKHGATRTIRFIRAGGVSVFVLASSRSPVPISDRARSSRLSVVEVEQTAESLATSNRANAIRVRGNAIHQGVVQISRHLFHPPPVRISADPNDFNPTALDVDREQHAVPDKAKQVLPNDTDAHFGGEGCDC
jgi:hypothetical protein